MPRERQRPAKPIDPTHHPAGWLHSVPLPDAREGGDSTWELWQEASRQLEEAFAPTQPSDLAPLSVGTGTMEAAPASNLPLTVDVLMVVARRNNRVCPRPPLWTRLYHALDGGSYVDLPPPPVERSLWKKLSDLQKRLHLREYIEWTARHDKLPVISRFLQELAEEDWLHMGEAEAGTSLR
jgi:hypothetical protein